MEERGQWQADWRDGEAYRRLAGADRSLFAWEWLRRDPSYCAAADALGLGGSRTGHRAAARFGLVAFEPPQLSVPDARPLWRPDLLSAALSVEPVADCPPGDLFDLSQLGQIATLVALEGADHLLLCDGLRAIRLVGPSKAFSSGPVGLRYRIAGLASAVPSVRALRQLLALCRKRRFSLTLHPPEARQRRWILMLRAWDALAAGAGQRAIAGQLLSRSVGEAAWRSREPSIRSQVQRLVRSARGMAGGGYRLLLH